MQPATRITSRSLTLHAALDRLGLLNSVSDASACLSIHVLGADMREGTNFDESASVFTPLCALLADTPWRELDVLLCGPNCMDAQAGESVPVAGGPRLRIAYSTLAYEDWHAAHLAAPLPHLAVAFNAGAWGYDSWRPCIELVCQRSACPLLLTSYNAFEAEEDEEVLTAWGVQSWQWRAEVNPHASDVAEARLGTIPHPLHENGSWMCFSGPLGAPPADAEPR